MNDNFSGFYIFNFQYFIEVWIYPEIFIMQPFIYKAFENLPIYVAEKILH